MDLQQFHRIRRGIQVNASPGNGPDLDLMEDNLRRVLTDSGLFEKVEVEHTDDPDQLVIALCQFLPFFSEQDVASRLERFWADRLRYPFWEAHATRVQRGHVEFEAATRSGAAGHYVTVHLVAEQARIPVQRTSSQPAGDAQPTKWLRGIAKT